MAVMAHKVWFPVFAQTLQLRAVLKHSTECKSRFNQQRCGLASHDLDLSNNRVAILMTSDSTKLKRTSDVTWTLILKSGDLTGHHTGDHTDMAELMAQKQHDTMLCYIWIQIIRYKRWKTSCYQQNKQSEKFHIGIQQPPTT